LHGICDKIEITMSSGIGQKFEEFIKIIKILREKCPWDKEQTLDSLRPYLIEEVYEAIAAIDEKDDKKINDEIGDMLLHVVMLSVFLNEKSEYSMQEVIDSISAKMVRRHPHVFGKGKAKTKDEIWGKWEEIKRGEKAGQEGGMLNGIPRSLPALCRADKIQKRVSRVGFDWDKVAGAWDKVHEELDEVHDLLGKGTNDGGRERIKEEIGDLLFAITNVARKLEIDAEDALQKANNKFIKRFGKIEGELAKKELTLEEMDKLWEQAKASES
jgi:nucleoside triphosphate diphosphatase